MGVWDLDTVFELGSLFLGLIAWMIAIVNCVKSKVWQSKKRVVFVLISCASCIISLLLQIWFVYYLVKLNEGPTIMDLAGTTLLLSIIMAGITILLNAMAVSKGEKNNKK